MFSIFQQVKERLKSLQRDLHVVDPPLPEPFPRVDGVAPSEPPVALLAEGGRGQEGGHGPQGVGAESTNLHGLENL